MPKPFPRTGWLVLLALWSILVFAAVPTRSYIPIDETRYVTVAWNMWLRGDYLVPWLNGAAYHHKPPLLFWLINLGWAAGGVGETWPRLLPALFSLLSAGLTWRLARLLWPARQETAELAPLILMTSLLWAIFTTATMFDILLSSFALLGLCGMIEAGRQPGNRRGFVLLALAIGGGLLAKGPVILLHLLVPAVAAPLWAPASQGRWGGWYGRLGLAFLAGAAIVLAWAIPAALSGGETYARAIFWGQTANRMVDAFAHKRPFTWYLPLLPLMLFPWFWIPQVWRGLYQLVREREPGLGFLVTWLLPVFFFFCLISGKQMHYLLPLFPGVALLFARALTEGAGRRLGAGLLPALPLFAVASALLAGMRIPEMAQTTLAIPTISAALFFIALSFAVLELRQRTTAFATTLHLAVGGTLLVCFFSTAVLPPAMKFLDVRPIAHHLSQLEAGGADLAFIGEYPGIFDFLGRLRRPISVLEEHPESSMEWCRHHPAGRVIINVKPGSLPAGAEFVQDYFDRKLAVIPCPPP
jgi:4-amino-4-deoxy-L-arabinose transferase-like glycosyltransferase